MWEWSYVRAKEIQNHREALDCELLGCGVEPHTTPGGENEIYVWRQGSKPVFGGWGGELCRECQCPLILLHSPSIAHGSLCFQPLAVRQALASEIWVKVLYTSPAHKILRCMALHPFFPFATTLEPHVEDSGKTRWDVPGSLSHNVEENFPTHPGLWCEWEINFCCIKIVGYRGCHSSKCYLHWLVSR